MRRNDWLLFFGVAAIAAFGYSIPWLVGWTHPTTGTIIFGGFWSAAYPVAYIKLHRRGIL